MEQNNQSQGDAGQGREGLITVLKIRSCALIIVQ